MLTKTLKLAPIVGAAVALWLLVAHSGDDESMPSTKKLTTEIGKTTATPPIRGKTGAAIGMEYELLSKPAIGEELQISLEFASTSTQAGQLSANLHTDDGLQLLEQNDSFSVQLAGAGDSYRHTINVNPEREGLFYVHVVTKLATAAGQQGRSFAVPVQVGQFNKAKHMKPVGEISTDSNGELIISTPAKESN